MVNSSKLYLLRGKETFLKQQHLEKTKSSFNTKNSKWINCEVYFADENDISKVTKDTLLFPSHNQFRVSIIKNIDKLPSYSQDKLLDFLKDVPAKSVVILVTSDEDISNNFINKLSKLKYLKQINCNSLRHKDLYQWIIANVKEKADKKISKDAISMLLERTDTKLLNLNNEIEKLVLYSRNDKSIEVEHVNKLIERNVNYNVFKLIDNICEKNTIKAVYMLNQMLRYNVPITKIVGALGWQLGKMLRGKILMEEKKCTSWHVAKQLGISSYFANKFISQVNKFSLEDLKNAIDELVYIDNVIKRSVTPPKLILEKFLIDLYR